MSLDRNPAPVLGAQFSRDADGVEMFTFVIDASNVIGPRKATDEDCAKHAEAYRAFRAQADLVADDEPVKRSPGRPRKV